MVIHVVPDVRHRPAFDAGRSRVASLNVVALNGNELTNTPRSGWKNRGTSSINLVTKLRCQIE